MTQNSESILGSLPSVYANFLPDLFKSTIPRECFATCANCAMVKPTQAGVRERREATYFSPDLKCCTYFPTLPNYLIGGILSSSTGDGVGRKRILSAIQGRVGVTPMGISPSRKHQLLYDRSRRLSFGKSHALLCPYYVRDSGTCSVWLHRNATCSTYFCKHAGGGTGSAFWAHMNRYMALAESRLSKHAFISVFGEDHVSQCMAALFPSQEHAALDNHDMDDIVDEKEYRSSWGRYYAAEEAFYIACYEAIRGLTHDTFKRVCGIDEQISLAHLVKLYGDLVALPKRLRLDDSVKPARSREGFVSLLLPLQSVSIEVPYAVFEVFKENIDVQRAVDTLLADHGVKLEMDFVWMLHKQRVLI